MKTQVQFEGFTVSATARTYNYRVTDTPGESRRFSVEVSLESFRATSLKFQDGPLLTQERLEQELGQETQEAPAQARLTVCAPDIQGYLERHYPPKVRKWAAATRL